jgi:hypothetical protein
LVSSSINANAQTHRVQDYGKNVNFYQLGQRVSTKLRKNNRTLSHFRVTRDAILHTRLGLISLYQIANTLRIFLSMTMARDRIGAAGRFDDNLGPKHTGRNMH